MRVQAGGRLVRDGAQLRHGLCGRDQFRKTDARHAAVHVGDRRGTAGHAVDRVQDDEAGAVRLEVGLIRAAAETQAQGVPVMDTE